MRMPSTPNLNLTALCIEGQLKEALHFLFTTHNPPVYSSIYLQLLQTCIAKNVLSQGKQIQSLVAHRRFAFATSTTFQNKLIDMYFKCGNLGEVRRVFDDMTEPDGFSWNVMIAAYRRHGFPLEALKLFQQMQQTGVQTDQLTFATILPACGKIRALEQGIEIHHSIIERGILSNVVVASALVDMYAKCGNIDKARELFDKMPQRNVVSWNGMITGYAQNGVLHVAYKLFKEMPRRDIISWNAMVAGYAQNGVLDKALRLFEEMPQRNVVSWNGMIAGFAQNGALHDALRLFKEMPQRNVVSWNAMIAGYVQNGFAEKALETFKQMQLTGLKPNSTTFKSILPACAKMGDLEQGVDIHQSIMEKGFLSDVVVASALVDMYAKCGSIHKARELFDKIPRRDVVSWNAMIAGYAQNGLVEKALETYKQMQLADVKPDSTTFSSILAACTKMGALEQGMDIHHSIIKSKILSDVVVVNALVDMYAKCGSIHKAQELFDKMPQRDVISWNALVAGYAQNGFAEKALDAFRQMHLAGLKPNSATFASILPACANMGCLEQGIDIHQSIIENGFLSDVVVASSLVDMYAKCGSIHKARKLFEKMRQKNVISWNGMIAGYAQNGFLKDALKLFELMKHSGTYPDCVSFACVLFACSHAGLVDEGCKYFNGMSESYCIMPIIDHYVCMVDLLGRAGYLEEALNFIIKIPIKPVAVVWRCLLGACRLHKNIVLGLFTATLLFELDPKNAVTYVLLSNIYAEVGTWGEVQTVRRLMKERGIKKYLDVVGLKAIKWYMLFVKDTDHTHRHEIYTKLEKLFWEMKAAGYFPELRHVPNEVEDDEKE